MDTNTPISEVLKQEQSGYTPSMQTKTPLPPYSPITPSHSVPLNGIQPGNTEKIIKTYRSDTTEAIKSRRISTAKIAIAEETRRHAVEAPAPKAKSKSRIAPVLAVVVLITLGVLIVPSVQLFLNQKRQEVAVSGDRTLLPFDHEDILTLKTTSRESLLTLINTFYSKTTPANIEYIKILETIQNAEQKTVTAPLAANIFAGLVGPNMPSALARSFDGDYMYGEAGSDTHTAFLLFTTSSYDQAFANMLRWEPRMIGDLQPVLRLPLETASGPFVDRVVSNKDVRAITAPDGSILFLYGFLDNHTLIITTSIKAFQDINNIAIARRFVQ